MPVNPVAVQNAVRDRLIRKKRNDFQFSDIVSAISSASPAIQAQMLTALSRADQPKFGALAWLALEDELRADASVEASSILADNSLTLDELDRVFGPF